MGFVNFLQDKKKAADDRKRAREQKEAQERAKRQQEKEAKERKIQAIEDALKNRMRQSPVLDMIFQELQQANWAITRQGNEDDGNRHVRLTDDTFEVEWSETHEENRYLGTDKLGLPHYQKEWVKNVFESVSYSYTKIGFAPLVAYKTDDNEVEISKERVISLWADVAQEKMSVQMPGCEFKKWKDGGGFTYTLPMPTRSLF